MLRVFFFFRSSPRGPADCAPAITSAVTKLLKRAIEVVGRVDRVSRRTPAPEGRTSDSRPLSTVSLIHGLLRKRVQIQNEFGKSCVFTGLSSTESSTPRPPLRPTPFFFRCTVKSDLRAEYSAMRDRKHLRTVGRRRPCRRQAFLPPSHQPAGDIFIGEAGGTRSRTVPAMTVPRNFCPCVALCGHPSRTLPR